MSSAFLTDQELESEDQHLSKLMPALLQIFLTIIVGFSSGLGNVIDKEQAQGLHMFVGKFSLPVLLFISLFRLDFSNISWSFLLSVLLTKVTIFVLVTLMDVLVHKPRNIGRAAIFGIFCTQSNDFGMGLPILSAVYGLDHPFVSMLYIVAPISLLLINPLGFILMELSKSTPGRSLTQTVISVLRGVLTNPVIVMTFLGVICNVIFNHDIPDLIENFLESLASAFTAIAPFCLGLSLVGNTSVFTASSLVPIFWIVMVKSVMSAIVTRTFFHSIFPIFPSTNLTSSVEMENFAFLYGSFPTANGVFVYASHYDIIPDVFAGAVITGTIVSAPIVFYFT